MTTPFGMPTFVKVGKKKTPKQLGAPGNVRPPTEVGQATLTEILTYTNYSVGQSATTFNWRVPSILTAGDLAFAQITICQGATVATTPAGWTLLDSNSINDTSQYLYAKKLTAAENDSVEDQSAGGNLTAIYWGVRANGTTLPEPASISWEAAAVGSYDPPSIAPGAGDFFVFVAGGYNKMEITAPPTGYTELAFVYPTTNTLDPRSYLAYKAVEIVTAEDPDSLTVVGDTAGGRSYYTWTMAIPTGSGDPAVAAGDHTHPEADITDLDHWTEADHDALDHTGLTGVGGADADAIHDNVAGEIAAITAKATPTTSDFLLIEDAADSNKKKRITIGDLPSSGGEGGGGGGVLLGSAVDTTTRSYTANSTYEDISGASVTFDAPGSEDLLVTATVRVRGTSANWKGIQHRVLLDGSATGVSPSNITENRDSNADTTEYLNFTMTFVLTAPSAGSHTVKLQTRDGGTSLDREYTVTVVAVLGGASGGAPVWVSRLAAPSSAHADDDEFNDASIGLTAITPTGTATWTESNDLLSVLATGQSSGDICCQVKAISSAASPLTIETAVTYWLPQAQFPMIGLVFADGTTTGSNVVANCIYMNNTAFVGDMRYGTVTNLASSTGAVGDLTTDAYAQGFGRLYMRLTWDSANSFTPSYSIDGVTWTDFGYGSQSVTITPTHMGVFASAYGSTDDMLASFEYLRRS